MVSTAAFQPFGMAKGESKDGFVAKGQVKSNGTILRMDPDGSNLEVYAWGLRNPFGLGFTPDGKLFCTEAGMDERGSRPIANAPDCLWEIKEGAWYGFPDFVAGEPVTDPKFRSNRGPAPEFLLVEHPKVEKPVLALPPHTGGAKFDLSRSAAFGKGQAYIALLGDMLPSTGEPNKHPGFGVARLDMKTLKIEPFFKTRPEALGPKGFEYVATAGPKRPVDVKFSPDGKSLYVVDFGAMVDVPTAVGPTSRPFPGTGTLWRITATQ
ncbi:MAG: PQQ-dependent sugar dehydrogenase [Pirellulaceae bacterium]